ncbi:hypothetical protein Y032_0297g1736 [Ancylostoma ceylanicum]|uniref:Protein-tyrosine phosphatase n=1 Tax=Ancylostoma ceylanicum TaxID=53326 RepID=A0A016S586_9BILA|nr:hypothetical protein Y032_0297g1736 [Ancylostoma ceylanicum]
MNILSKTNMSMLRREFMKYKKYKPTNFTFEVCKKNEPKNRYDDVICIDATRVVLKERSPDDDYIHANWMSMPDRQKYICTQGPLQETLADFWHMIFTEKSTVIVMLCSFKEGKNEKCAVYHPKTKNECGKFGPYRVFLREEKATPFTGVAYRLLLYYIRIRSACEVHHLAFTDWPDHTAPVNPGPIVGMMKYARMLAKGNPITVHCSAGIGRSATFVGIDYAMQRIQQDSKVTMVDVLKDLRNQRYQSVQGIIQYIFLHICVLEGFAFDGVIPRKGKFQQYMSDYNRMLTLFNRKIASKMSKEQAK